MITMIVHEDSVIISKFKTRTELNSDPGTLEPNPQVLTVKEMLNVLNQNEEFQEDLQLTRR